MATGTGDVRLTPELVSHLLRLSESERVELGNLLLDSVEYPGPDPDAAKKAFQEELAGRIDRYKRGEERAYTLDEVMADLRAQSERRRSS
jgi:putative addiction module component (TIGR02574 family)